MSYYHSRKQFLNTSTVAAAGAVLGPSLFGANAALSAPSFTRRDIGGLAASDPLVRSYEKAVTAMQARPATDPLSWSYQAAIHGTMDPTGMAAWNSCEHNTEFFWSWHRMYLYWFERIVRKMSSDDNWALPYWNWASPSERGLPAPFRDTKSVLYTANRNSAMNDGSGSLPASYVDYSNAFSRLIFTSPGQTGANDIIQGTPHGDVHVGVGGWMGLVPTAARDPIFYLHHANIDRLWQLWRANGGGRKDPLGDPSWKFREHIFFDESGSKVTMTACDIVNVAQQLNYSYDVGPTLSPESCSFRAPTIYYIRRELRFHPMPPPELGPNRVSFVLDGNVLRQQLTQILETRNQTIFLELQNVVAAHQPGVVWGVYVGLPASAVPDTRSPFFVGNLSLFGTGIRDQIHGSQAFKAARFAFAINRAVALSLRLHEKTLPVTFVPQGILINGKPSHPKVMSTVSIGQATLTVETVKR